MITGRTAMARTAIRLGEHLAERREIDPGPPGSQGPRAGSRMSDVTVFRVAGKGFEPAIRTNRRIRTNPAYDARLRSRVVRNAY